MLSKLIKHEFKATAKLLIPLYLILLFLTIMDRIVLRLNIFRGALSVIPGFITFFYVLSIIAVVAVTFLFMIIRFYKNLMTDEGYLMFTLPVKSYQLINSKLIVSFIWIVASVLAVVASLYIVIATPSRMDSLLIFLNALRAEINHGFGSYTTLLIIEFFAMIIIGLVNAMLTIYVSIAVGQLMNAHKLIGAIAAYIGISTIIQIISTIGIFIIGHFYENTFTDLRSIPLYVMPISMFLIMLLSVIYYWVMDYIFRKKLNLE